MSEYQLTWITDHLAVGYAPMSYADLAAIRDLEINAIVNLCGEFCDLHEIEEQSGFDRRTGCWKNRHRGRPRPTYHRW